MAEAETLASRLLAALAEPVEWDYFQLAAGASIGITVAAGDAASPPELIARADLALYEAKQHGGQAVGVYDETLQHGWPGATRSKGTCARTWGSVGEGSCLLPAAGGHRRAAARSGSLGALGTPGKGVLLPDALSPSLKPAT